jgi:hypothetical protein
MSIILKHNKKMDLKIPEFLCDGGVAPHLEKYDIKTLLIK